MVERMKSIRTLAAVVALVVFAFGTNAQANENAAEAQALAGVDATLTFEDGVLVAVSTDTTEPPTTTTTLPPTTTTTQPPTATTTTTPPEPDLGPDPANPNNNQLCAARLGINDFCHYDVRFNATLSSGQASQRLWETPYSRRAADGTVLWVDGTRDGYRQQWQFIQCDDDSEFEGRVAFIMGYSPQIASFQINDTGGQEGQLMWDGSPNVPPGRETGDGPRDQTVAGPNYNGPSQPPTFRLYHIPTGRVCEVRDYKTAESTHSHGSTGPFPVADNVTFKVDAEASTDASFVDDRAAITAPFVVYGEQVVKGYLEGVEAITGYYTSMDRDWEWHHTP